ncbi:unnamed protein product [Rhizoctonia solani]|uniref:NADPH-ferrihemoprotein reductase n=1 Tax=Rhizoctonia solani TaxID=456999 RepID=A0A8H3C175_9AGAM|nr:unnamed protein product [Rhizoctonia solani]
MVDIVSQLVLKWERFGPQHEIDLVDDGARLALDTIVLCTSKYRINSFYYDEQPSIVAAITRLLKESNKRLFKPKLFKVLPLGTNAKYRADTDMMMQAERVLHDKAHSSVIKELPPNTRSSKVQMANAFQSSSTQTHMLLTWVAGYKATATMLSSTINQILKHTAVYNRIRKEVDTVLGKEPIRLKHLGRLTYLTAVWREALRLAPSSQVSLLSCIEDGAIGHRKHLIKKGTNVVVLAQSVGRDPVFWGEDAEIFNPDRMLDGRFEALPPGAWIPFGSSTRQFTGERYAWQQALVSLAMVFQKFDITLTSPSSDRSSTASAQDPRVRVTPRKDAPSFSSITSSVPPPRPVSSVGTLSTGSTGGTPLYVFYGSNTGSCEGFAQIIVSRAPRNGFGAIVETLDNVVDNLPVDGPVIIVTASFEGEPADNAGRFVKELTRKNNEKNLGGVSFAVFGAGNHEWTRTYQQIPRLIDATLEKRGAKRLLERGEGDAGGDSFTENFCDWEERLWETLSEKYSTKGTLNLSAADTEIQFVSSSTDRATALRQPDAKEGLVIENRLLTAPGVPPKHHLEIKLPEGMTYQSGNYLAVLPLNPPEYVRRVLVRFKVPAGQQIVLKMAGPTSLPTGRPVNVSELLSGFVEIGHFANKRNVLTLLEYATDPVTRSDLESMLADFKKGGKRPKSSMLSLLEKYHDIKIPLGVFIVSLPPMRPRQYTISSSPLWNPNHVTLTVGVVAQGQLRGVGSNYLGDLSIGEQVLVAVRPSAKAFHPPTDPSIPMVLFAAGSGLAPFRGFLQERAMQLRAGHHVEKSVLFFGCRKPEEDYLYGDNELAEWSKLGIVDLKPAFSRAPERSEGNPYVQIRIWAERQMIHQYYDRGAKFYTCGGSHIAAGIREVFIRILAERLNGDQVQAEEEFRKIQFERYATPRFT